MLVAGTTIAVKNVKLPKYQRKTFFKGCNRKDCKKSKTKYFLLFAGTLAKFNHRHKSSLFTKKSLFTKFLTPELTCKLCNTFDDWLKSNSATNHSAGYIIIGLTRELKVGE